MYNIRADPTEHHEIGAQQPQRVQQMLRILAEENRTLYLPPVVPDDPRCCTVAMAQGGFIGPFLP